MWKPHVSGNEACAMWKPHVSGNEARAVANRTFLVTKLVRYGNRTYRRFYTNKNSRASLHRSRLFLFSSYQQLVRFRHYSTGRLV